MAHCVSIATSVLRAKSSREEKPGLSKSAWARNPDNGVLSRHRLQEQLRLLASLGIYFHLWGIRRANILCAVSELFTSRSEVFGRSMVLDLRLATT